MNLGLHLPYSPLWWKHNGRDPSFDPGLGRTRPSYRCDDAQGTVMYSYSYFVRIEREPRARVRHGGWWWWNRTTTFNDELTRPFSSQRPSKGQEAKKDTIWKTRPK